MFPTLQTNCRNPNIPCCSRPSRTAGDISFAAMAFLRLTQPELLLDSVSRKDNSDDSPRLQAVASGMTQPCRPTSAVRFIHKRTIETFFGKEHKAEKKRTCNMRSIEIFGTNLTKCEWVSVGAGEVWSGVGTLVVARAGEELNSYYDHILIPLKEFSHEKSHSKKRATHDTPISDR
jgi:hypothetical protein